MARKPDIKAIDKIEKDLELSREQRQMLHREISGQNFSLDEIRELAKSIKEWYPNK